MTQPEDENPLDFHPTRSNVSIVKKEKPMPDSTTFSTRSNAKRAAEKAIRDGASPSIDYKLHTHEDGRVTIVWKASEVDTPEQGGQEIERVTNNSDKEDQAEHVGAEDNGFGPDPWPPGTRVQVSLSKRRVRQGTVDYQVDQQYWRVFLDGEPHTSSLCRGDQLSAPGDNVREIAPAKNERRVRAAAIRPSKSAALDAAAARGIIPDKPVMTSKANAHVYQPRFDFLAERAAAGDWDAIRSYQVKGINTYAKMVKQYRDRLLTAHDASTASASETAA